MNNFARPLNDCFAKINFCKSSQHIIEAVSSNSSNKTFTGRLPYITKDLIDSTISWKCRENLGDWHTVALMEDLTWHTVALMENFNPSQAVYFQPSVLNFRRCGHVLSCAHYYDPSLSSSTLSLNLLSSPSILPLFFNVMLFRKWSKIWLNKLSDS